MVWRCIWCRNGLAGALYVEDDYGQASQSPRATVSDMSSCNGGRNGNIHQSVSVEVLTAKAAPY
eukprot:scaffold1274_cov13-Prasinocladus_malaysianus.AAC.1